MSQARPATRVMVVDDDPDLLDLIDLRLSSAGYDVTLAASGAEALERFRVVRPRVVISDLRMEGMDGHALFKRLHAAAPSVPVIILTAHGTIPDAVAATQRGVFSFLTKPFDGQELLARVADAVALSPPIAADSSDGNWRSRIVSSGQRMDEVLRSAHRLADLDEPFLILGPRGSGKELLARTIHDASTRQPHPLRIVRCASADDGKDENWLAKEVAAAKGGTLLFDDIDLLTPYRQAQLLPLVAETGLFGHAARDTRIVAISAQNPEPLLRNGQFRTDLYYRLSRNTLILPSLAERREDIPLLVSTFTADWFTRYPEAKTRGLSPDALTMFCEASWPGNIRQLRNLVEQALAQAVAAQVPAAFIKRLMADDNEREMAAFDDARRSFEAEYLTQLLKATAGNVAQAARIAQRNRTEFYKLLARHALDPAHFKQDKASSDGK